MPRSKKQVYLSMCAALWALHWPLAAMAQEAWPARAITVVVPTAPGSGADALARIVAPTLQRGLGQPIVIDNRPGANSLIGAQAAARAPADGYTLFLGSATTHAVNPSLYGSRLGYAPGDLEIVATIGAGPVLWLVPSNASAPASTRSAIDTMRATANANCAYGNSVGQVACALVAKRLGLTWLGVPYRSTPQALNDAAAGLVTAVFADAAVAMPYVTAGKLRVLAVAYTERLSVLPGAPTLDELGHADIHLLAWSGLFVPRGTPAGVQERLNRLVASANDEPAAKAQLARSGGVQLPGDIAAARAFAAREAARWVRYVGETGVKPE
jgi:tripartite-type tricarboxylate transporter receptor subunit TctC